MALKLPSQGIKGVTRRFKKDNFKLSWHLNINCVLVYTVAWNSRGSVSNSPNIVRVIKSRRLRWAGHVARMDEGRSAFEMLTGKHTRKRL